MSITMKTREVVIFSGDTFTVPQCIQRIDKDSTHGWQVRYQGTKLFSDGTPDGSGASKSLDKATKELLSRIATMPAPVTLQRGPSAHKTSNLPPGISGPIVRARRNSKVRSASFSVLLPQFGKSPRITSVYIGNENTYTADRYRAALGKAINLRQKAEERYEEQATLSRRRAATAMKKTLREARVAAR
jgi:hypothetical protein